jgi:DNA-binding response OmpR family regulator
MQHGIKERTDLEPFGSFSPPFKQMSLTSRPRVLLAEDDEEMRVLLAVTLRRDGFEVLEARNGAELLKLIAREILENREKPGIDLIVSDIRMPEVSGIGALASFRKDDWATPVLLITAFGDDEVRAEAKRLGAAAVFSKPFDMDDFRTVVLNLVGNS